MKIYVASSWRNARQPLVVRALRILAHDVYDFRAGAAVFHWQDQFIDAQLRDPGRLRDEVLSSPTARDAFDADMAALRAADATVLVMPCWSSAHLELGLAIGLKQQTFVLLDDPVSKPELMWLSAGAICTSLGELLELVRA